MAQLYNEVTNEPPTTTKTKDNPRDGLQTLEPEPTLPNLGPGGMEVTITTSMEHDSNTEEIVDNETVRVDKEVHTPQHPGRPHNVTLMQRGGPCLGIMPSRSRPDIHQLPIVPMEADKSPNTKYKHSS